MNDEHMQVMKYYKHKFTLDYCAHGGRFKKATTFWTTSNILRHHQTNPQGFNPLKCQGWKQCGAMVTARKHYPFDAIKLVDRQAIPAQVSIGLGVAIAALLQRVIDILV